MEEFSEEIVTAQILDGKQLAQTILGELKEAITTEKLTPILAILLIGDDPSSVTYVNQKKKKGEEIGIQVDIYSFANSMALREVEQKVLQLNLDPQVSGIIIQLPLPSTLDKNKLLGLLDPRKDVDGLLPNSNFTPATPAGIMELLKRYRIALPGKRVAVFGAGSLVGKPVSKLLTEAGATVSVIDINTPNPKEISQKSEIVVAGIGQAGYITKEFIKKGAVVVDAGSNRVEGKLVGDIDFDQVKEIASYITPVPGGVGPMTVVMLLRNVVLAARKSA